MRRNESSLDMKVEGIIDLFFSDSDMPIREQEIRRFLPQISPYGLILMHDASSGTLPEEVAAQWVVPWVEQHLMASSKSE